MAVGVFFDGFSSTAEMLEVCREAELAGASSLWFAQHMGYREAVVSATAAASVTQSATLVPVAISPYLWPPLPVAMAISTLGEFARGRVILNVSVGNILNLSESGVEPVKPIRIMREYVEALRALWAGKPVTYEGTLHKLRGAKMVFDQGRQYPIYVASTGPQMLKLAGEIADGVLLSAGLTLASTRRCLDFAQEGVKAKGRDPAAVRTCSLINCKISQDGTAAKAAMLRKLAFLFRSRGMRRTSNHLTSISTIRQSSPRMHGTILRAPCGCCRSKRRTSSPSPAPRRNAALAWKSISPWASTNSLSRCPATPKSASSRSTLSAKSRGDRGHTGCQ